MSMASERGRLAELQDEFIGTVSHELRTPLAIVMTGIDSLRKGLAGELSPKQSEIAEMCHRNVLRLNKMINSLLDISRLESGAARGRMERVDVGALAAEMTSRSRASERGRAVKTRIGVSLPLPDVRADPELIAQAFDILLDNAQRFAASSVCVSLRAARGAFEGREADGVRVQVSDDGPGIPRDRVARLFSKFTQVARSAGPGYKGTGLGLAICKEILTLHGSTIVVARPRRGACFQFFLPEWKEHAFRKGASRHG